MLRKPLAAMTVGVLGVVCLAHGAGPATHERLDRALDPGQVRAHVEYLAGLGSRVSGYPGNARAADYILARFRALGLETYVQEFDLPTPLDEGCTLEVGGKRYEVGAIWPNLVRTSQVQPEGLSGPLIYVGQGRLADFDGKAVEKAIVLMEFNTQQNWLNAPLLGAGAVVFLEPQTTTRGEAEMKFLQCPVNVPRFYLEGDGAVQVRALAASGSATATLRTKVSWVNRVNRNIIGILPGADPTL